MVELQPSKLVVWVRFPSPAFQGIEDRLAAAVAQLVERFLGKDEVMGSSPISSFFSAAEQLDSIGVEFISVETKTVTYGLKRGR
jgi:hypothetical protein